MYFYTIAQKEKRKEKKKAPWPTQEIPHQPNKPCVMRLHQFFHTHHGLAVKESADEYFNI